MNHDDLIGMVAEATSDLCHWPYVYSDADLLHVEKCEFCQLNSVIELRQRNLLKKTRKSRRTSHE